MEELPKAYAPAKTEKKIYSLWMKSGFFNPDKLPERHKKPFSIVIPPPNVTGELHMGHALNAVIQDVVIRKKRMEGYKTLWLPGTDHAGIATQNKVEQKLKKEGKTRFDLGREKFVEEVWKWKEQYGSIILGQLKQLGASCDWSRTRFTMDKEYEKAVREAFMHYYKKGWIYRGERTINWCPRCRTSLSDLEIEYREVQGKFYYIKYGPLTLGTVRPETKLGDTALAVNPKDKRYKKYIGKEITIQSVDSSVAKENPPKFKEIHIKVVGDAAADPDFGTGVIKVTPAHALTDFEIYERHPEIPILQVIGQDARMTENAGIRYQGLKVSEAREQIVKDLEELGLIEKIEDYTHNVAICYRCNSVIEPLLSKQWFLKMGELSKVAIAAVKKGEVKFVPKRWEKIYLDWLKNIRDWNISRQLWWGHQIPVENSEDVLDTWFSAALWPFATLGWPQKTKDLKIFYPTQILSTARDIINLWVVRMVFSSYEFTGKRPFQEVVIHPTVLTKEGQRMSKSLGTGIDPVDLIKKYGADATRFGIAYQMMGGQDIHFTEDHIMAGRKFCNKIWNISRFVMMSTYGGSPAGRQIKSQDLRTPADKKILSQLKKTIQTVDAHIAKYQFGHATHVLYDFVWHDFADVYIEKSKKQKNEKVLLYVLLTTLKLLHPFTPFITEEIYQTLPLKKKTMLLVEKWPT